MITVEITKDSKYGQKWLKDILKSVKNGVRVLIIYIYWLSLETVSLILKEENVEREYVFIFTSDNTSDKKKNKLLLKLSGIHNNSVKFEWWGPCRWLWWSHI